MICNNVSCFSLFRILPNNRIILLSGSYGTPSIYGRYVNRRNALHCSFTGICSSVQLLIITGSCPEMCSFEHILLRLLLEVSILNFGFQRRWNMFEDVKFARVFFVPLYCCAFLRFHRHGRSWHLEPLQGASCSVLKVAVPPFAAVRVLFVRQRGSGARSIFCKISL
jgi:hypothetical protein